MTEQQALTTDEIGTLIGEAIMEAVRQEQLESPRSQQTALGMSQLGGCREYIRATIAGDPANVQDTIKWPAFVGTALGDHVEQITQRRLGTILQDRVTLEMEIEGLGVIYISGSTDIRFPSTNFTVNGVIVHLPDGAVVDLKSKAELDTVRRSGPSFKEKAQIAGYLVAAVQEGKLGVEATGHLVYIDRSGRDKTSHVWSTDYEQAQMILEAVASRLDDVAHALATGQRATRDEQPSWCKAVQCEFYAACWGGYAPTGAIDHEPDIEAVEAFVEARAEVKAWEKRRDTARDNLKEISGITPDGTIVEWKTIQGRYGEMTRLEVTEGL